MTTLPDSMAHLAVEARDSLQDVPVTVAPGSAEEVAEVLRYASDSGLVVQVVGGGTHSGYGAPPRPDIVLSTERLSEVEAWEPEDLTIVVGGGARVSDVENLIATKNQTAVMPEVPGSSTVGGVISAGVSALRRGRLYGTRERVLEATLVTGDGRIVRGGGRVVKNVSGYDLPRMTVGAFGSLGVLVSACLKLWPAPPHRVTVEVGSPEDARAVVRPLAVLEQNHRTRVFLWGTEAEIEAKADRLDGDAAPGHDWPANPVGLWEWSLRVPPAQTSSAIARMPEDWEFLAVHGVGDIRASSPSDSGASDLRRWAESIGGALVVTRQPEGSLFEPWGSAPPALDLQRRLIAQFDPARVINPGRLPGGL